ncbi:hypothetical protein G3H63_04680 [Microbacterium resistens]|uniref:hypothetical protein n=1 Tax=Microbacterium resistens TaxID=156977 RepID=UPI001C592E7A|nr:hypothetical protein [Microbacterium resistens]MBW1638376.1 hypothetical protein [Microbacterium resistens]
MRRTTIGARLAAVSGALAVVWGCAACSDGGGVAARPVEVRQDLSVALKVLDFSEVTEYVPMSTTALGEVADVVIEGRIERWLPGGSTYTDSGMFVASVVAAEIHATSTVRAHDGVHGEDSSIFYVKVIVPTDDTASFAEDLPTGMPVLAYLNGPFAPELNEAEGYDRKPGSREVETSDTWRFAGMQGFVVQDGPNVLWPSIGVTAAGSITDARPGGPLDGLSVEQRRQAARFEQQVVDSGRSIRELYSADPRP